MTNEEKKEVVRICGPNYEYLDIPAYIRQRDEKEEIENASKIVAQMWAEEN